MSYSWWGRDCYCVGAANLLLVVLVVNDLITWLDSYDGDIDHKYVFL
jgi:CDP-4-dehydro-6-deoxyglucose reductase, E1